MKAQVTRISPEAAPLPAATRIDTARLTLVAPTADDAQEIFDRYASAAVTRYLGWPRHQTLVGPLHIPICYELPLIPAS